MAAIRPAVVSAFGNEDRRLEPDPDQEAVDVERVQGRMDAEGRVAVVDDGRIYRQLDRVRIDLSAHISRRIRESRTPAPLGIRNGPPDRSVRIRVADFRMMPHIPSTYARFCYRDIDGKSPPAFSDRRYGIHSDRHLPSHSPDHVDIHISAPDMNVDIHSADLCISLHICCSLATLHSPCRFSARVPRLDRI